MKGGFASSETQARKMAEDMIGVEERVQKRYESLNKDYMEKVPGYTSYEEKKEPQQAPVQTTSPQKSSESARDEPRPAQTPPVRTSEQEKAYQDNVQQLRNRATQKESFSVQVDYDMPNNKPLAEVVAEQEKAHVDHPPETVVVETAKPQQAEQQPAMEASQATPSVSEEHSKEPEVAVKEPASSEPVSVPQPVPPSEPEPEPVPEPEPSQRPPVPEEKSTETAEDELDVEVADLEEGEEPAKTTPAPKQQEVPEKPPSVDAPVAKPAEMPSQQPSEPEPESTRQEPVQPVPDEPVPEPVSEPEQASRAEPETEPSPRAPDSSEESLEETQSSEKKESSQEDAPESKVDLSEVFDFGSK